MPIYAYKGLDKSGREVKGSINSENEQLAKSKIRQKGIMLVGISVKKSKETNTKNSFSFGNKVPIAELALMTRQLATLVKAKIQIVESISALGDQVEHPQLKVVLSEVKQKVNEGSSLAKALADYPKIFDQVYVNMVEAGEQSGTLEIVLMRLADFTEGQMKLKNKILGAVMYPLIIGVLGFCMMLIIFVFVIPKLEKVFKSQKKQLPLQTEICLWLSQVITGHWYIIFPSMFFAFALFRKWTKSPKGKVKWHNWLLKMPVVNKLFIMMDVSRFCSTLATLLNSGVPLMACMRIVKNLITNLHIQMAVDKSREEVSEGKTMTGPLINSGIFPTMVTHMISLGEKSGELEPMLKIVSENYEDQIDSQLGKITATLQPLMMVILGGLVFFIVMSVIMPIMDLNKV